MAKPFRCYSCAFKTWRASGCCLRQQFVMTCTHPASGEASCADVRAVRCGPVAVLWKPRTRPEARP